MEHLQSWGFPPQLLLPPQLVSQLLSAPQLRLVRPSRRVLLPVGRRAHLPRRRHRYQYPHQPRYRRVHPLAHRRLLRLVRAPQRPYRHPHPPHRPRVLVRHTHLVLVRPLLRLHQGRPQHLLAHLLQHRYRLQHLVARLHLSLPRRRLLLVPLPSR